MSPQIFAESRSEPPEGLPRRVSDSGRLYVHTFGGRVAAFSHLHLPCTYDKQGRTFEKCNCLNV